MRYLETLTIQLAQGAALLDEPTRRRHGDFLLAAQRADGGFAGREGESDLYYTSFALRGLAVLGLLEGPVAERAAGYLQQRLAGKESVVDLISLVYAAAQLESAAGIDVFAAADPGWRESVAATLERTRRDDGGYARGSEGAASSTYQTFLVLLTLQLIDQPIQDAAGLVRFLLSQCVPGGGFREIRASKRAATNPTAAAIGGLRILNGVQPGALEQEIIEGTLDFLVDMQSDEGGLRANTRIPFADLLSSFTGSWTLQDLNGLDEIDVRQLQRYARSLEDPQGGFLGAAVDDARDVEYTFYGIGTLALIAWHLEGNIGP